MENDDVIKLLEQDPDGLLTYEYIANHIDTIDPLIDALADHIVKVDPCGQFVVSAARYLHAIDASKYAPQISRLVAAAIDKDRERRYIADLLTMWGPDYADHVDELTATDNNFRRIYKRLYPAAGL